MLFRFPTAAVVALLLAPAGCKRSHDQGSADGRSGVTPIRVDVVNEPKPLHCPDGSSNHSTRDITIEWCERPDGTRHGPAVTRLKCNGVPDRHETYSDGELDGDVIDWHIGVRDGDQLLGPPDPCVYLESHPDRARELVRVRAAVTPYRRGKAHGMHTEWSESGHKVLEGPYRDGVAHGAWKQWSDTGTLLGTYQMDEGSGVVTRWRDDTSRAEQWHEKDGKRHGRYQAWHQNGALAREGMYIDGRADGTWKQWAPDGALLGTYGMTAGTGTERVWNDDGTLASETEMKGGVEVVAPAQ